MDPSEIALAKLDPTRIFGDPYQADGVTLIPVTRTRRGRAPQALGVYAVAGDQVSWHPVVDHDRIALIGVATGFVAAVLGSIAVIRRPPWPDLRRDLR